MTGFSREITSNPLKRYMSHIHLLASYVGISTHVKLEELSEVHFLSWRSDVAYGTCQTKNTHTHAKSSTMSTQTDYSFVRCITLLYFAIRLESRKSADIRIYLSIYLHITSRHIVTHTHTHTRLAALCPGLSGWAGTRKVKPICILLK